MDTDLSLRILNDLFLFEIGDEHLDGVDMVVINLNSVFSTTYYEEMINHFNENPDKLEEYVDSIGDIFKKVLIEFSGIRIVFIGTSQKSKHFLEIYPKWRHRRYDNKDQNEFAQKIFGHFTSVFEKLHEVNPMIELVDTEEFDPAVYTHAFIRFRGYEKPVFLVSRDRLDFLNLVNENVVMFDGQQFYTEEEFENHEVKKLPNINIHFLKFYYLLRGIKKYDYPGVRGYGVKRTSKYLKGNMHKMVDGTDKYLSEDLKLFDFDKFINGLEKEDKKKLLDIVHNSKF